MGGVGEEQVSEVRRLEPFSDRQGEQVDGFSGVVSDPAVSHRALHTRTVRIHDVWYPFSKAFRSLGCGYATISLMLAADDRRNVLSAFIENWRKGLYTPGGLCGTHQLLRQARSRADRLEGRHDIRG